MEKGFRGVMAGISVPGKASGGLSDASGDWFEGGLGDFVVKREMGHFIGCLRAAIAKCIFRARFGRWFGRRGRKDEELKVSSV